MRKLSLQQTTLKLYHIGTTRNNSIFLHSFYNNTQIIPKPKGDFFSSGPSALLAQDDDSIVMFIQPPDLLPWRRKYMNNFKDVNVVEINPNRRLLRKGYPEGCIINHFFETLKTNSSLREFVQNKYFLTLFPTKELNSEAENFGLKTIQEYDSITLNSKSILHKQASKYGFRVSRYYLIQSESDFEKASEYFRNVRYGCWLKAEGSGGDLVFYVKKITPDKVRANWLKLKNKVVEFFKVCRFKIDEIKNIVNPENLFPIYGLLLEEDIKEESSDYINGAAMLSIDIDGRGKCIGIYNQDPLINPFCGTNKIEFDEKLKNILRKYSYSIKDIYREFNLEIAKMYRYVHDMKFVGIFGVDFFFTFDLRGIKVIFTEVNARITNNSGVNIAAAINNNSFHHMPLTIISSKPMNSIADLSEYTTFDGKNYLLEDPQELSIMPQTFSSVWSKDKSKYSLIESGNICRILILGRDHEKIIELTRKIYNKGAKFL
jgi:hypothetical protein